MFGRSPLLRGRSITRENTDGFCVSGGSSWLGTAARAPHPDGASVPFPAIHRVAALIFAIGRGVSPDRQNRDGSFRVENLTLHKASAEDGRLFFRAPRGVRWFFVSA